MSPSAVHKKLAMKKLLEKRIHDSVQEGEYEDLEQAEKTFAAKSPIRNQIIQKLNFFTN